MNPNTCINRFYRHRQNFVHFDDTPKKDEWQLEVYLHALGLMKKHHLRSVIDLGCGSGFKLVTYLSEYDTMGIEVPATCRWLKEHYPDHRWMEIEEAGTTKLAADVVICSDVIEHVINPDDISNFLKSISFQYAVISTPARDVAYRRWERPYWGPPRNPHHIREWTQKEFRNYMSQHFEILDHRVTNLEQATQMIVCRPLAPVDRRPSNES